MAQLSPEFTARLVAEKFGKEHGKVLEKIKNLECSQEFNEANFRFINYIDSRGRQKPMYDITRAGFMFLAQHPVGFAVCPHCSRSALGVR